MRRTRRVGWKAAGLLLAATAAGPALAQGIPGQPILVPLPDDVPPGYPRPVAAQPARPAVRQAPAAQPDVLADVEVLPPPRTPAPPPPPAPPPHPVAVTPAPAGPACGPDGPAGDGRWFWQRWRAERHAKCQAHMWGYPEEFEAPPLGQTIHAHFRTMVANGEAAAMVLYRYDFCDGSDVLNLRGRDQLTKIAAMLRGNGFPIIIERTPEAPALAEARRAAILNVLAHNAIALPPERVVIGPPIANGLSGEEAERLYQYHLNNQRTQATPIPATGSVTTGSGFGGTSAGFGGAGGPR